jgi:hypothetical protein
VHRFFFIQKKFTVRSNYWIRTVEPLRSGSTVVDFPYYTTFFPLFLYAGSATAAARLQRRRIHTRML